MNGTTALNSVGYEPLGPINGWTSGNGATTSRTYDTDGKISQITSAGTKTYTYDNAFRITGISDTSTGSANWTYGYDALDRITSGASTSITRGWTYDANGNRLTETGSTPSTYSIASTNNRINSITGGLARTYGYDAAGNTASYSTVTATYNNAGRLNTLAQGGTTETVVYNALGQRIKISGGVAGTVLYAYDESGHLLGEYDGTGALIEETVWLGDIPVATLRPNGASVSIYYVHSDQLNTPRQVTRPDYDCGKLIHAISRITSLPIQDGGTNHISVGDGLTLERSKVGNVTGVDVEGSAGSASAAGDASISVLHGATVRDSTLGDLTGKSISGKPTH